MRFLFSSPSLSLLFIIGFSISVIYLGMCDVCAWIYTSNHGQKLTEWHKWSRKEFYVVMKNKKHDDHLAQ